MEKDSYNYQLIALIKSVNPEVELVETVNISRFERDRQKPTFKFEDYDYLNELDFDCIIVKIGENSSSALHMANNLIELIDHHIAINKEVNVFIGSMFGYSTDSSTSQNGDMNKEFYKVAQYYETDLVMINKNGGPYGNQFNAVLTSLPPKPDGTQPKKDIEVIRSVTEGHPGNSGHEMIANSFWNSIRLKYNLDK